MPLTARPVRSYERDDLIRCAWIEIDAGEIVSDDRRWRRRLGVDRLGVGDATFENVQPPEFRLGVRDACLARSVENLRIRRAWNTHDARSGIRDAAIGKRSSSRP